MDLVLQAHNPPPYSVSTLSEHETSTLDFRRLTRAPRTPIPCTPAPHTSRFHHSQTHPPLALPALQCSSTFFHPPRPFPCIPAHFQPLGPGSPHDLDIAKINPYPLELLPTPDSPSPLTSHSSSVPGTSSWTGSACQIPGSSHTTQHLCLGSTLKTRPTEMVPKHSFPECGTPVSSSCAVVYRAHKRPGV